MKKSRQTTSPQSARYRAMAEYYDAEYADKPMLRRDVPFLLKHLPKQRQSVLELACGTGRAAIPLAQAGHRVVGVDIADDMLAIARRKRDGVGLDNRQLKLVKQDCVKLKLSEKFDWIVILFNTFLVFTTLEEQDKVLTRVREHLKPNGSFWIDIFQPDFGILSHNSYTGIDGHHFHVPALDRSVFQQTDIRRHTSEIQKQRVTFRYSWFDPHGGTRQEKMSFDMTYIFPRELQLLLERNGFKIKKLYGDYDGNELTISSPRLIAWCEKR